MPAGSPDGNSKTAQPWTPGCPDQLACPTVPARPFPGHLVDTFVGLALEIFP